MTTENNTLGKWALLDIETSGADASVDEIIDVGFLQFEGTKLIQQYESLCRPDFEISKFIQKLTGIDNKMLKKAPRLEDVIGEVLELDGHDILAHNADFEEGFLDHHFEKLDFREGHRWQDSLYFLSLIFPHMSSLKLENFIVGFGLADKELHRGLQDSVDLLKVVIVTTLMTKKDAGKYNFLMSLMHKYSLQDYWFFKFLCLYEEEVMEIAEQIDFDPTKHIDQALAWAYPKTLEDKQEYHQNFDLKFSGENVKKIFGDEEKVSTLFNGYKYRQSQEGLALKVGQSFKNHIHSMIQAPTGTGKTLGYLVPAALFAITEQKQVLIATGTKTLQAQAMNKDVPALHKLLGVSPKDLKIRQLVGSSNHFCELLFTQRQNETDLFSQGNDLKEKFADIYFDALFYHNSNSALEHMIAKDDLPFVLRMKLENFDQAQKDLAVDYRACSNKQCPFYTNCTYIRGLRDAKEADIIVGNHALMFSWTKSFPRPAYVVVDEAHKIEGEATNSFSAEVGQSDLESLQKQLQNLQGLGSLFYLISNMMGDDESGKQEEEISSLRMLSIDTASMLREHLFELPDKFEMIFKKMPRYTDKFWNELPMIMPNEKEALRLSVFHHLESIYHLLKSVYDRLYPYTIRWQVSDMQGQPEITAWTRFESFVGTLEDVMNALSLLLKIETSTQPYSFSMKYHEKQGFLLSAGPINTGKILHDQLLQTSSSVVYTSATLGNEHGDLGSKGMEWSTGYLYSEPERRFRTGLFLPSVYDYKDRTRVFLCDDTPSLYDKDFVKTICDRLTPFIEDIDGRSLLLFSARARFEKAVEYMLDKFEGKLPVFVQGMGANVVEDFKESGNGILIGMESFGEGIDVPGDALRFVFIDKIPDLSMDQVVRLRREYYETNIGNEFEDYYLAHRTRSLHQKLGRLLRTESDAGAVVVIDSRIKKWKNSTMAKLTKQMEPYQIHRANFKDALEASKDFVQTLN